MGETKFKYADPTEQIQKVNILLCVSATIVYLLTFTVVIVSVIQGNRTPIYAIAMFAVMLGTGRSLYAKIGKNISRVLFFCGVGATLCYLVAAFTSLPLLGLFACAFTGFCTSMLWPGSLIVTSDRVHAGGVFIYALMAAGGDLGASIGPQIIGIITDTTLKSQSIVSLAQQWGFSPDQLGMKIGMLAGALFPLIGIFVYLHIWKTSKINDKTQ